MVRLWLSAALWLFVSLLVGCGDEDRPRRRVEDKTTGLIDPALPGANPLGVKPAGVKPAGVKPAGVKPPVRPVHRGDGPWRTRETRLLTAAEAKQADPASFLVSPDGGHFAYAVEMAGGYVYVVDGVAQATPYRRVFGARFSDDGKDFACIGVINEVKFAVVLNGKPFVLPYVSHFDVQPKAHTIVAVGGGRVAYTAWEEPPVRSSNWTLSLWADGKPIMKSTAHNKYYTIRPYRLAGIAAAGRLRLVTPTMDGIAVDGKLVYRTRDNVKQVVLSADGSTWAAVLEASAPKKEFYVVVNGQEQKRFEAVHKLVVTPDGKHVGYLGVLGKRYVIIDGKGTQADWPTPTDFHDARPSLALGPDGRSWAVGGMGRPISDRGIVWPELTYGGYAAPSPDGRHVATVASVTEQQAGQTVSLSALVRDGKEEVRMPAFASDPVWSPNSASLAIVAVTRDRKSVQVVRDGVPGPAFESVLKRPDGKTPILEFSRDGASLAYAVRVGLETKVVINDKPRGAYDLVGYGKMRIGFTPDGRVAYIARKTDGSIWWVEESQVAFKQKAIKPPVSPVSKWEPLFDGGSLAKWGKSTGRGVWMVEDKLLVCHGKLSAAVNTLGDRFGDFRVRVVARTTRGSDAFIVVRGAWVRINNTGEIGRSGSIYPSAYRGAPPNRLSIDGLTNKTAPDDEWFTLDVLVSGTKIATRINGKRVALADLAKDAPRTGTIGLHYHGRQTIEIRRIEVRGETTADDVADAGKAIATGQQPPRRKPVLPKYELEKGFVPLFDGKSLAGWNRVAMQSEPNPAWAVKDGLLRYEGRGPARIVTRDKYTDFHLRIVARTTAGNWFTLFSRLEDAPNREVYTSPYGYKIQLKTSDKGDRVSGELGRSAPGSGLRLKSFSPSIKAGEWFTIDWIVRGGSHSVLINGSEAAAASDRFLKKSSRFYIQGRIGLLATGNDAPCEVYRIDVKTLK